MTRRSAVRPRPVSRRPAMTPAWKGAAAGLVAGGLFAVATGSLSGVGVARLLTLIAATMDDAYAFREPGLDLIVLGAALHLAVSAFWGALFAVILAPLPDVGTSALRGAVFGLVVLGAMTFGLVPAFDPALGERVGRQFLAWVAGHLVFGVALALLLHLQVRGTRAAVRAAA
jgi:hypothetical protein